MKWSTIRIKRKKYDTNTINIKHNLWRIENDLKWIFKNDNSFDINIKTKICLYWLDINLKNTLFPWVLKIERELKAFFIFLYKKKFNTDETIELLNEKNYVDISNKKNPLKILNQNTVKNKSIDEVIFTLTFGEFVYLIVFFDSIKSKMSSELKMNPSVFVNVIKFFNILRNAIAHNKTIIKIRDEKNNKRFSLKKDFFDFDISKNDIDIISTNASGSIYAVKVFLEKLDNIKKSKAFIKQIKKNFKLFYKTIPSRNEYERIIKLIFLSYYDDILKI